MPSEMVRLKHFTALKMLLQMDVALWDKHWIEMLFDVIRWYSMVLDGIKWYSMVFESVRWYLRVFDGCPDLYSIVAHHNIES